MDYSFQSFVVNIWDWFMNKVKRGISVVCCIIIPVTHPYLLPPSNPQFQLILLLPSFFLCSFMSPIPYSGYPYLMP